MTMGLWTRGDMRALYPLLHGPCCAAHLPTTTATTRDGSRVTVRGHAWGIAVPAPPPTLRDFCPFLVHNPSNPGTSPTPPPRVVFALRCSTAQHCTERVVAMTIGL